MNGSEAFASKIPGTLSDSILFAVKNEASLNIPEPQGVDINTDTVLILVHETTDTLELTYKCSISNPI